MSVRKNINEKNGVFFITFTCARWLPLFQLTNGYDAVYKWFEYLKNNGHFIIAYVIMPDHVHAIIAFRKTDKLINTILANGKRFMAYDIVKRLRFLGMNNILDQLASLVNRSQKQINKQHEVFEPSFEQKECFNLWFLKQKTDYIHLNPCKKGLAALPEDYPHSSASYYFTGVQKNCAVITYLELQDVDLGRF